MLAQYYVLKIRGYHEVTTNLPGSFMHGRDEIITPKPIDPSTAYTMCRRLNNPAYTIRKQVRPA
jgi:hypothetical protein